jgi:hypothetical protein
MSISIELWKQTSQLGSVCACRWFSTTLREVLLVRVNDLEVFNYVGEHGSILIICNRDDYLSLAAKESNPGIIILMRRLSRHVECGPCWRCSGALESPYCYITPTSPEPGSEKNRNHSHGGHGARLFQNLKPRPYKRLRDFMDRQPHGGRCLR